MVDYKTEQKIARTLEIAPLKTLEGHLNGVDCLRFNPTKPSQLISGSFDHTYRCWDIEHGTCVKEVKAHEGGVWGIDFAPDGKTFATASADKTLKLWDAENFKEIGILKGHTFHVYALAYSPNGAYITSSAEDGTVKVWDVSKKTVLKSLSPGSKIGLSVQYSQDGKYIFVSNSEGSVIVYETGSYTEVARTEAISKRAFSVALDFSARDERYQKSVFVAYEDHHIRRWRFDNNSLELEGDISAHLDHCKHVSLDGSNGYYVTCGRDGSAKVWSAKNNELLANLVGATDATTMSALAKDSRRTVAVSSWDQRVRLYQMPEHFEAPKAV